MRRAKQMAPEERQQHLLGIAIKVFAEKGLDGAKHGDVARAAGVSIPTVHSYFRTRDDLVTAVLGSVRRYIIDNTMLPFIKGGTFESRMLASGNNLSQLASVDSEYFKVWVMWGSYFGEPFKKQFEDCENEAVEYLCQMITGDDRSVTDENMLEKARVLLGLAMFLTQMILRGENQRRQEIFVNNVMQTMRIWL